MPNRKRPTVHGEVDKGWAWIIMAALFTWNTLLAGTMKSFGVLYLEFLELYQRGPVATAWIGCTFSLVLTLMAPISGYVGDHVSLKVQRRLVMVLSVVMATCIAATGWMPNLESAVVIYGLAGFSASLVDTPILSLIGKYFKRRRFLASGFIFAGSSFGTLVLPPIFTLLVDAYAIRGAMIVFGGFWLNVMVVGAVIRPVEKTTVVSTETSEWVVSTAHRLVNNGRNHEAGSEGDDAELEPAADDDVRSDGARFGRSTLSLELQLSGVGSFLGQSAAGVDQNESIPRPPMAGDETERPKRHADEPVRVEREINHGDEPARAELARAELTRAELADESRTAERVNRHGDDQMRAERPRQVAARAERPRQVAARIGRPSAASFGPAKSALAAVRDYWSFIRSPGLPMLMLTFFGSSFGYFNQFFIFPALGREVGMTRFQGAMLLSVSNVAELASRLGVGQLVDSGRVSKFRLISVSFVLSAVLAMAASFATNHVVLFAYSALFGSLGGVFLPLAILLFVEAVPETHVSSASGLFALVIGSGISIGPPVLGAIKAWTGSFADSLRLCSLSYIIALIVYVLHEADTLNCVKHCKTRRERRERQLVERSVP